MDPGRFGRRACEHIGQSFGCNMQGMQSSGGNFGEYSMQGCGGNCGCNGGGCDMHGGGCNMQGSGGNFGGCNMQGCGGNCGCNGCGGGGCNMHGGGCSMQVAAAQSFGVMEQVAEVAGELAMEMIRCQSGGGFQLGRGGGFNCDGGGQMYQAAQMNIVSQQQGCNMVERPSSMGYQCGGGGGGQFVSMGAQGCMGGQCSWGRGNFNNIMSGNGHTSKIGNIVTFLGEAQVKTNLIGEHCGNMGCQPCGLGQPRGSHFQGLEFSGLKIVYTSRALRLQV